jgi:hypothetical protein
MNRRDNTIKDRYFVRWQQIRAAGTTLFGEHCPTRDDAADFAKGYVAGARPTARSTSTDNSVTPPVSGGP